MTSAEYLLRTRTEFTRQLAMPYRATMAIVLALATTATFRAADDRAASDARPAFEIVTKRDDDRVEVRVEKDVVVFSVHSPVGISQATVERTGDKWPQAVVLRLHLKGLEKFRATAGKIELHASVSTQTAQPRVWIGDKESAPLDSDSPLWLDVRLRGVDGKPAKKIPLEDGYFELRLPKVFFDENPKAVSLNWIDFYRK